MCAPTYNEFLPEENNNIPLPPIEFIIDTGIPLQPPPLVRQNGNETSGIDDIPLEQSITEIYTRYDFSQEILVDLFRNLTEDEEFDIRILLEGLIDGEEE
jgi:hypothetical protein